MMRKYGAFYDTVSGSYVLMQLFWYTGLNNKAKK